MAEASPSPAERSAQPSDDVPEELSPRGYGPVHPTGLGLGLHHVQLAMPVGQEAAARAFWVDVLGLVEVRKPPELAARGGLWVRGDGVEIHLGVEPDFRPASRAHPGLEAADLDGVARRLEASGVAVRWDDSFPGHRRFYAADPFGNRLEFLTRDGTIAAGRDTPPTSYSK